MPKHFGLAVAAGLTSAILFLLVGGAFPPLVYLAPLPLLAVGLGFGLVACVLAAGIALLAVAGVAGGAAALPFAVTAALPSLVVVRQALLWRTTDGGAVQWYPPGLLVGWLAVAAAGGLVVAALLMPSHPDGLEALAREQIDSGLAEVVAAPEIREALASFLPAMVGTAWVMVTVLNAVLAQSALVRANRNLRPTPAYQAFSVPDWLAGALVASVAVAWLGAGDIAYLARNIAVVLLVPYVLLGLAGIHGAARQRPNGAMLLAAFYGLFFLLFGWAVIVVAGLGLVRHWIKLRRRLAGGSQEEE